MKARPSTAGAWPVVPAADAVDWAGRRGACFAQLPGAGAARVVRIGGTLRGKEAAHSVTKQALAVLPEPGPWAAAPGADAGLEAASEMASKCAPPALIPDAVHVRASPGATSEERDESGPLLAALNVVGAATCTVGSTLVIFGGADCSAQLAGASAQEAMRAARLVFLEARDDASAPGQLQITLDATGPTAKATQAAQALEAEREASAAAAAAAAAEDSGKGGGKKKAGKGPAAAEGSDLPAAEPLLWPSSRTWHAAVAVPALRAGSTAAEAAAAAASGEGSAPAASGKGAGGKAGKGGTGKGGAGKGGAGSAAAPADDVAEAVVRVLPPPDSATRDRVFVLGGEGPSGPCGDALWVLDVSKQLWYNPAVQLAGEEVEAKQVDESDAAAGRADAPLAAGDERGVAWSRALAVAAGVSAGPSAGDEAASSSAGPAGGCLPLPRSRFAAAFVPETREIVINGGQRGGLGTGDTWALHVDSLRWRRIRVPALPALRPRPVPSGAPADAAAEPEEVAVDPDAPLLRGPAPGRLAWHSLVWANVPARYLAPPKRPTADVYVLAPPRDDQEESSGKGGKDKKKGGAAAKDKKKAAGKDKGGKAGKAGAAAGDGAAAEPEPKVLQPWERVGRLILVGGVSSAASDAASSVRTALMEAARERQAALEAQAAAAAAEAQGAEEEGEESSGAAAAAPSVDLVRWVQELALDEAGGSDGADSGGSCDGAGDRLRLWALDPSTGKWDRLAVEPLGVLSASARWTNAPEIASLARTALDPAGDASAADLGPGVWGLASAATSSLRPLAVAFEAPVAEPPAADGALMADLRAEPAAAAQAGGAEVPADEAPAGAADDAEPAKPAPRTCLRLVVASGDPVAAGGPSGGATRRAAPAAPVCWLVDMPPWDPRAEEACRRAAAEEAMRRAPTTSSSASKACVGAACADGAAFTGTTVKGLREGEGTALWEPPSAHPHAGGDLAEQAPLPVRFEGTWRNDVPVRGTLVWSDGVEDTGSFAPVPVEGASAAGPGRSGEPAAGPFAGRAVPQLDGHGRRVYPEGATSRPGATSTCKRGATYDGQFVKGVESGLGRLDRPDGSWVRSEWTQGAPHGSGDDHEANGDHYNGELWRGLREGEGRVDYHLGGWYRGSWRAGMRAGAGEEETRELHRYRGKFCNGHRAGLGHCLYPDGGQYEGNWLGGKRHGEGSMAWASGRTFSGTWANDRPHGEGFGWDPESGLTFTGEWRAGRPEGKGRAEYSTGEPPAVARVYEGTMVRGAEEGGGRCRFADGCIYIGEWRAGKQHGEGQLVVPFAGAVCRGTWRDGTLHGPARIELGMAGEEELETTVAPRPPSRDAGARAPPAPGAVTAVADQARDTVAGHRLRPRPRTSGQIVGLTRAGERSSAATVVDAIMRLRAVLGKSAPPPAGVFDVVVDSGRVVGNPVEVRD